MEAGRLCGAVGQLDVAHAILSDGRATMNGEEPCAATLAAAALSLLSPDPAGADAAQQMVPKTIDFCIKNDDLCIKNDESCIENDESCV